MFNIFGKSKEVSEVSLHRVVKGRVVEPITVDKPVLKQTNNEIVEEIHDTFFTEVDKLLAEAKIMKSLDSDLSVEIKKAKRLEKLGFTSTKIVIDSKAEILRLQLLKDENKVKKDLIEAINYFSFNYPNYKFITQESVTKICKKYGLIQGEVDKYVGDIPDKNLKEIEDFKLKDCDSECYIATTSIRTYSTWKSKIVSKGEWDDLTKSNKKDWEKYERSLNIVAPTKDFNMTNMKVVNHQLVDEDPIVLKPVAFKGIQHFLIVAAWGLEATDELVINPINN